MFTGQEKTKSTFSVVDERQTSLLPEMGQGNALYIDQETMTANMHAVQKRNNLPLTSTAEDCQFCIEMETGTGKTYVYTKTIFELNRKYGFTKFVIVVPSVAIREGVDVYKRQGLCGCCCHTGKISPKRLLPQKPLYGGALRPSDRCI